MKSQRINNIAALKTSNGEWIRDDASKAELLAENFVKKNVMLPPQLNCFSDIPCRGRYVLEHLDPSSATGPDKLPTRILRECADELAKPLLFLACVILRSGRWPEHWTQHWIVPLHKRKAVYEAGNYRGIHLTAQLSKAMERLIGTLWLPDLASDPRFCGPNQFAYFPFSLGTRNCIGKILAETEIYTIIKHLFYHYDFELMSQPDVKSKGLITLKPDREIKIKLNKRSKT
jgi:hypothetical protein